MEVNKTNKFGGLIFCFAEFWHNIQCEQGGYMLESLHAVWMRRGILKTRASRFAVVDVEKNIDINDVSSFYASTFPTPTTVFF